MNTKIMIIDAHPVYINKTVGFLESLTFKNIEVVARGSKAVETVIEGKPDIIVLSAMLPDADSLSIARQIKAAFPTMPIIVQTGLLTTDAVKADFNALGMTHVIARREKDWAPFSEAINAILGVRSSG